MNQIPLTPRALRACTYTFRTYSTGTLPHPRPPVPKSQPQPKSSKGLQTALLVSGGGVVGLGAYYFYDPNADVFKQAKSVLGIDTKSNAVAAPEKVVKKINKKTESTSSTMLAPPPPTPASPEKKQVIRVESPVTQAPVQQKLPSSPVPLMATAAAAATTAAVVSLPPVPPPQEQPSLPGDSVPKYVLITALRAQQEALSESHESKIRTIQSEYDRRLSNATQVIEAERVVDLRAKYEKASSALNAIEQGIEARTTQNTRAKRLRALWAQVNALHARVNHPEYHDSTTTSIDKPRLVAAIEVEDKFVSQMVSSLPNKPVHSLESLKTRFYDEVEPLAKSVTLIKDGEGFSMWKYALGKVFASGLAKVNRGGESSSTSSSPVQNTANSLDSARSALEKSDLLTAAIAVNQLRGLPRQVASDWLADARTLLETNQTLFVLMTYAASNNVF